MKKSVELMQRVRAKSDDDSLREVERLVRRSSMNHHLAETGFTSGSKEEAVEYLKEAASILIEYAALLAAAADAISEEIA